MSQRERKAMKRQRLAMQRYVALRMEEDIETSVEIVSRKARRMRKAQQARRREIARTD
ncbi:hypothetical protein [Bradyrhizobium elkanii]|uniref:hypothetical protein n=1 Tax=Bradyrhizobium elkanii TaxID=29448 RepID=UPI0004ACDDD3|nr:hypothetical protein [Bradyrhizobium elkanii]WLA79627.1 hypothetical protein QNJ99_30050 [Bradyrhizobium elkanii]